MSEGRKYIFFDVDGVLIHGYHFNHSLRHPWDKDIEADLGISRDGFDQHFFKAYFGEVILGHLDLEEALNKSLPLLKFSGTATDIINYWLEKDSIINDDLFPTVKKLSSIRNVHLYIATNQEKNRATYLWNTLGFKKYFKDIYYSGRLGVTKHSQDFFELINRELGILPGKDTVIYFDDTPDYLIAAEKAGWQAYQFTTYNDVLNNGYIKKIIE